jgi:hypothetical protein
MLIFDYEHQKILKENNNESEGIGFCIKNNIDFLILSQNLNAKFPLKEEEKDLVLKYIQENFKTEYDELNFAFNVGENFTEFKDFGFIDSENFGQINIFTNKSLKYFSYNNKIFKISKKK